MKKLINKIKNFNDSAFVIRTDICAKTDLYRTAHDETPAFRFNTNARFKFGFLQICIIVISAVSLVAVLASSISAKHKKRYKKKLGKMKAKFEKKQAKLEEAEK